jgi:hypothetical protein
MFNGEEIIQLNNITHSIHWEGSMFLIDFEDGDLSLYDVNTVRVITKYEVTDPVFCI